MKEQNYNQTNKLQIQQEYESIDQLASKQDKFNKTLKKNKFDDLHVKRQSNEFQPNFNLPHLVNYKTTINIFGNQNHQFGNQNPQIKKIKHRDSSARYRKDQFRKTIFSNQMRIDYKNKINQLGQNRGGIQSRNSKSRSKSSKSSSMNKIQLKKQRRVNKLKGEYLNVKGNKIHKNTNNLDTKQCLTDIKPQKVCVNNHLSAKDIILSSKIQNRKYGNKQKLQKIQFKNDKQTIKQDIKKYEQKIQVIVQKDDKQRQKQKQTINKSLQRVESGLDLIRQKKLKRAKQQISKGDIKKGTQILNLLLKIDQNDIQVMYLLSQISQKQNKNQLSNKYLKHIILTQSNNISLSQQIVIIKAFNKLNKYQEALQKIDYLFQHQKDFNNQLKFQLLTLKGQINLKTDFLQDALESFQAALNIYDQEAKQKKIKVCIINNISHIYINAGQIYLRYKMYKKALLYFNKVLSLQNAQISQQKYKQIEQNIKKCTKNIKTRIKILQRYNKYSDSLQISNIQQLKNQKGDKQHKNQYKIRKLSSNSNKQKQLLEEKHKQEEQKQIKLKQFNRKLQQENYIQAYKILITNQKGQNLKTNKFINNQNKYQFNNQQNKLIEEIPNDTIINLGISLKNKGFYQQALNLLKIQNNNSLVAIQQCAKLNYKLGQFDKCYDYFEKYVTLSVQLKQSQYLKSINNSLENHIPQSNSNLIKQNQSNRYQQSYRQNSYRNQRHIQIAQGLNAYMNKIKQLQVMSVLQQDFQQITKRRNYNIAQAIKLFQDFSLHSSMTDSNKLRALSVIGQQSTISIMKNQDAIANQSTFKDIFSLKQFRQILTIWKEHQFSLQSLNLIAPITYQLVKHDKTDFSILPLHIINYTMKMIKLNQPFLKINQKISNKMNQLCKLYPPSQKSITQSQLKKFQIDWVNKTKVNLFNHDYFPESYKDFYKKIQTLSVQAAQQKYLMDQKCKEICHQFKGFSYKSNLKLQIISNDENQSKNQRSYGRIIQKILSKDLQKHKSQFLSNIQISNTKNIKQIFFQLNKRWQETIDSILKKKKSSKQPTACYVYDLMRAKCMFSSIKDIDDATQRFIIGDKKGEYQIIQIDNRLNNKTKDVVLKIKFKQIVGELQLALQFQSQKNQFNHSLYQLSRSPFGPFFASFMWFTGFSSEYDKLIVNQKLKWKMKRLQNVRKFVYEDKLTVQFGDSQIQSVIQRQFKCKYLILTDFVASANQIQGYLMTSNGKYIQLESLQQISQNSQISIKQLRFSNVSISVKSSKQTQQVYLGLFDSKPNHKFRLIFEDTKTSLIESARFKPMFINLIGSQYFWHLSQNNKKQKIIVLKNKNFEGQKSQMFGIVLKNSDDIKSSKYAFKIQFKGQNQNLGDSNKVFGSQLQKKKQNYKKQIQKCQKLQKQVSEMVKSNFLLI